jgi:hypothetical protein
LRTLLAYALFLKQAEPPIPYGSTLDKMVDYSATKPAYHNPCHDNHDHPKSLNYEAKDEGKPETT